MTDVSGENPTFAELYPEACIPATKLHQLIGASRIAVLPFVIKGGESFEPREVMDVASEISQRGDRWRHSFNEVAYLLIEHAGETSPVAQDAAEEQVDQFFDDRPPSRIDPTEFLETAERTMPKRLYQQVLLAYSRSSGEPPAEILGHSPVDLT